MCIRDRVDIVAHHGVEPLIREIQLVRVPMLEYAPGRRALACGVFLAHSLVVAEVCALSLIHIYMRMYGSSTRPRRLSVPAAGRP